MTSAPGLGISIYLSEPEQDNLARLAACPRRGVTRAFTSLQIPEDPNVESHPQLLRRAAEAAVAAGVTLFADISPATLRRFGLTDVLELQSWGLPGVRFDDGFGMATVAEVSRHMAVQLNASTITPEEADLLVSSGADMERIEVLHNYYPRVDTGLSLQELGRRNARLRALGLHIGAFAPGNGTLRGPLFDGLPTCEEHRHIDPLLAAVQLWRGPEEGQGTDTVYVGDIDLADETWDRWSWLAKGVVPLRWHPAESLGRGEQAVVDLLRGRVVNNRPDPCERVVRVQQGRFLMAERPEISLPEQPVPQPRPRGSVTVDNEGYGRYRGEVQLVRRDRPADPRVTVLGHIAGEDLDLLDLLPGGAELVLLA